MTDQQRDDRGGDVGESKRIVRVHIDREPYDVETPTSGTLLYEAAEIPHGFELFREVGGDAEDEPVERDNRPIHLREDEHFYSQRDYRIIVNAREEIVDKRRLSYAEVVALAAKTAPAGPDQLDTVTYRKGPRANPRGTLQPGESVFIKNGMIFVVTPTNRS